jgi:very-short-patch-repair endonuclease
MQHARNAVACKLWKLVESPIEHILGLAIFDELKNLYDGGQCWFYSQSEFEGGAAASWQSSENAFVVVPQLTIADVGRVDFAIFVPWLSIDQPQLIVEGDGHDFHDRTPEQASRDRKRMRALQRLGIPVLPYTGTDIIRNSGEAAWEVAEFVNARYQDKKQALLEWEMSQQQLEQLRQDHDQLRAEYDGVSVELLWHQYGVL